MNQKNKLFLLMLAMAMSLSGCGRDTVEPQPNADPPIIIATDVPAGWHNYVGTHFTIALPEPWKTVDVAKEGLAGVQALIQSTYPDMLTSNGVAALQALPGAIQVIALDPQPQGAAYVLMYITSVQLPSPESIVRMEALMKAHAEQNGATDVAVEHALSINGLVASRLTLRPPAPIPTWQDSYYYYIDEETQVWLVSFAVMFKEPKPTNDQVWAQYEATFTTMAHSFQRK